MGQAISIQLKLRIARERQSEGTSYVELQKRHGVSYNSVRSICAAYESKGEAGLVPNYSACGRPLTPGSEKGYRLVRLIKHFHPDWGVPYITTRIRERYPELKLLSDRQYQRRLKADPSRVVVPAPKLPKQPPARKPRQVHDEWQVDAKERIALADGSEGCYLNVTDTKSNAMLKAKAFPPGAYLHGGHATSQTDPA
ncbi:MAG: helix-turn-helix domain-containing protein [Bacteroidetes bacterium]|nr:MAG: helix-turn-helix domain-containing protein [Bacteroidota bacterium]